MHTAPIPLNETARLLILRDLAVLDTPPEKAFDDLTSLAAYLCKCPISLLSLVDADRQWFKSRRGLEATETSRDIAFCAHAILNPTEVMVVRDATTDDRFADNPLVTGPPHIRFYAGAPLVASGGEALGTLCVIDRKASKLNMEEVDGLCALARQAMAQLELRGSEIKLKAELENARQHIRGLEANLVRQDDMQRALLSEHSFQKAVIERAAEGLCVCHAVPSYPFVKFTVWNPRMVEITGYTMEQINRLGWYQTVYPDAEAQRRAVERMERMRKGEDLRHERWVIARADQSSRVLRISTSKLTSMDGLNHVLALMEDFTEEERLKQEAMLGQKDALTGVGSLRTFRTEARKLIKLASRAGTPTALGFIDLDDLKLVNDRMGHAEGDRVLECFGALLNESTRFTDLVGRVGGDEFALLLPDTNAENAKVYFDRLHRRLLDAMRSNGWQIGISIGVAIFLDAPANESEALSRADSLMYEAKATGKNRVVYGAFSGTGRRSKRPQGTGPVEVKP